MMGPPYERWTPEQKEALDRGNRRVGKSDQCWQEWMKYSHLWWTMDDLEPGSSSGGGFEWAWRGWEAAWTRFEDSQE